METIVSVDIGTNGPTPFHNSMLSLGATARHSPEPHVLRMQECFYRTVLPLPGTKEDPATMRWWARHPERLEEAQAGAATAQEVIPEFCYWLRTLPQPVVLLASPASYDHP